MGRHEQLQARRDDVSDLLAARFRQWEIVSAWDILTAIGMVEGPCILHAGGFDSVGYEQQRSCRRAMLQKLRKLKLIRWRPTYRKWQYIGDSVELKEDWREQARTTSS